MLKFALLVGGILLGIVSSIFGIFPTDYLLDYFVDRYGRYPVAQVYGGTFLFWLMPVAIVIIAENLMEKWKKKK